MKNHANSLAIDVDALRIGLYVHLDGGWMSHPFALSSFRISSAQQIATIRALGLKRVRWSPERSEAAEPLTAEAVSARDDAATDEPSAPAPGPSTGAAEGFATVPPGCEAAAEEPADASNPCAASERSAGAAVIGAEPTEGFTGTTRRPPCTSVAEQRAALQLCERQFAEATRDCEQMTGLVPHQPQAARKQSEALSRAFVDKLLDTPEVCIRLLTEGAGERAASHAVNVAVVSLLMGKAFCLPPAEMLDLGVGALLHDIGKIGMPDRVRHRDEPFSAAELAFYQEHVARGVAQGRRMGLAPGALLVIGQHHEHADGSGFPLRLNSDRMSLASRIVSLVDRYDNLCNPPVPSRALTPHEAVSRMFAQGKSTFDTAILGTFIRMMGVYPPGSAVQLTDDRYAMVMSVNSSRPLKPRVLVHEPRVPREEALIVDLESQPRLGIRRSLKPLQLPHDSLGYLAPRPRVAYFFEPAHRTGAFA